MKTIVLTLVAGWAVVTTGATAWRDDLWLGRGSFWTARVAVTVENPTGAAWEGKTVAVPLAQLPLKACAWRNCASWTAPACSWSTACGRRGP